MKRKPCGLGRRYRQGRVEGRASRSYLRLQQRISAARVQLAVYLAKKSNLPNRRLVEQIVA
jgi:hypothetical protein